MDWFSWLSKAGLDPSLVYEYGLAFANNELEREDISYFNHEFLQSMGISIAKHRLEIIKLAKKETGRDPHPMSKLLDMIMKTRSCIVHCINAWLHRDEDDGAIVVVHGKKKKKSTAYSKRWRGALLKRSKSMMLLKQERLMLTDESFMPTPSNGTSPILYDLLRNGEVNGGDSWWPPTGVEDTRWASMFHDLKPN